LKDQEVDFSGLYKSVDFVNYSTIYRDNRKMIEGIKSKESFMTISDTMSRSI